MTAREIRLPLADDTTETDCGSCRKLRDLGVERRAHVLGCVEFGFLGYPFQTGGVYKRHAKCRESEMVAPMIDEVAYVADLEFRGSGQVRRPPPQQVPDVDPSLSVLPTSHVLGEYAYRDQIIDADSRGSLEEIDLTICDGVAHIDRSVVRRFGRADRPRVRINGSIAEVSDVVFPRPPRAEDVQYDGRRACRTVTFW